MARTPMVLNRLFSRQASPARGWTRWAVSLGVVATFSLLDAIHTYVGARAEGNPLPWGYTLYRTQLFWLIYAAFLPSVFFIADRYRLDLRGRRLGSLLIHVAGALTFTYLHIIAIVLFMFPFALNPPLDAVPRLGRLLRFNFAMDFLTYWAIVGTTYAFHYYSELRQRELAAAQIQASLTEARLRALQAQLNPHFLFNTLNAVSVLALKGQHNTVVEMLARLSDLLRRSLDDKRPQQVPLAQELEFLDTYLDIQRLRFGDRLTIEQRIAPDTIEASVPCMILQPLVENAVVHGISTQRGRGRIAIEAERDNGSLRLRVSDSGPGFGSAPTRGNGIGLAAIEARLGQLYGTAHRIEYGRSAEGGASVTISIPMVPSAGLLPLSSNGERVGVRGLGTG